MRRERLSEPKAKGARRSKGRLSKLVRAKGEFFVAWLQGKNTLLRSAIVTPQFQARSLSRGGYRVVIFGTCEGAFGNAAQSLVTDLMEVYDDACERECGVAERPMTHLRFRCTS